MPQPSTQQVFSIYSRFDADKNGVLDRSECLQIVDALVRFLDTFSDCDKDGIGRLEWNNGEIRNFITACFRQQGSPPPSDQQIAAIYSKFDADNNGVLDRSECLQMVDALFRPTSMGDDRSQATMRTFSECDKD